MKILHFKNHFKMSESNVDLSPTPEVEKYLPIKTNNAIVPVTIKQIIEARPSEDQLNSKIIDFVPKIHGTNEKKHCICEMKSPYLHLPH